MVTLFEGLLPVAYGYGSLSVRGGTVPDIDEAPSGQANGLLGAGARGALSMMFGLHTGPEPMRVDWSDTEPQIAEDWEDIVEASVTFTSTDLVLSTFDESVSLTLPMAGPHRARYCATGMDAARNTDTRTIDEAALDRYLLQLWPHPITPDVVVLQTSDAAAYWHAVARGEAQPRSPAQDELEGLAAAFAAASERRQDQALIELVARVLDVTGLSAEPTVAQALEQLRNGEAVSRERRQLDQIGARLDAAVPAVPRSGRIDTHGMAWRRWQGYSALVATLSVLSTHGDIRSEAIEYEYGPTYHARWALDSDWADALAQVKRILATP